MLHFAARHSIKDCVRIDKIKEWFGLKTYQNKIEIVIIINLTNSWLLKREKEEKKQLPSVNVTKTDAVIKTCELN